MKTWTEYFVCNLVLLLAFTFCIVLIFSTNASAHTWQIEKVDNAERYTETAIAISQAGFPHIVYSDIRYAYHDSGRWNLDPSFESYPSNSGYSLAIDANGLPHLCYYNLSRELVYKHYNGKKWQSYYWDLQLFSTRPVHPSLQLDNYGRPHIVHPDDGVLCYRYFDGTTWQKKTFDTSVNSPNGELKLDSNGLPHIAYEIWSAVTDYSKLIYLRYDGESWHQELLFSGKNLRGWEFDLDSNDAPHFVILNIDLKHLYTTEIGWQTDVLETANTNYYYLNFKIDSQDNMHLAYYDHENKDLIYAFYDGTLRKETVDQQGDVGRYVSLAVDNNNLVHLAYIDDSLGHMKYARMISDYYPYAQFNMFGDDGEVPFEINFSDHSTGEITSWFWDFGDGATSTERNPVHIYQKPGHYDTSLIVSGPGGSSTKKLVNSVWAFQLPQGEKYIAYVGEKASFSFPNNVLTMIDCETNIVADQVNIPDTPHGLSTSKDGRNLLISLYTSGYAAKISTIDPEKATFFNVPGASGSVISPDDSQFYVCSDTAPHSRVTKINVHDDNYRFIDLEDFVGASTPIITPDSTSLFVADTAYKTDGGVLAHIKNPFSEDPIVEPVFIVGCSENALAISPNGRHIYASSRYDIIKIPIHNMHLPELQVKLRVPMAEAEFPWAMAISPDNRWLYMTTTINNVHIVDLNTFELVNTIVVGGNPRGVAITPDGKYAYVCRWFKICVIDVAQQTIIDEIPIDRWGFSITIAREPRSWCDILISPSSFQTCDVSGPYNSPGPKPSGLAFDGTYLWNADYTDDKIYKLDTSGNIIDSFDSPGPDPRGLAFDGTYLWNADYTDDKIYKLDTSGYIIDSFDSPGSYPTGLAFDGTYLWNADNEDKKIYKLDTLGNIIDSFDSPGSYPYGLAFDGTYLWNMDSSDDKIYKLDTSGNGIDYLNSPGWNPSGLTFDGTYLWNADYLYKKIYKLDTSGNIIDSFDSPGPYPSGLAFDGTYLWNADYLDDKIYKLDTSGNIIDSFDSPGIAPMGLTFDGIYLWNADLGDDKIYKLDTSGNIIDSFDSPLSDPRGLAFDGTYLWHADNGVDIISKFCNVPGPAKVGSSKTRTFTITNAGKSDLEIDTLCITGADASEFIIENNSCSGQTVGVLGKCTVDVVFSPISTGKKTANLEIPSNDPDTPILIVTLDSTPLDTFNSDFNGDGDVDGSDLAEFAANFDAGLMVVFAAEFGR